MVFVHFYWWFQHVTGIDAPGSRAYNFWSGFGSDITEFAVLVSSVIVLLRKMEQNHKAHMKKLDSVNESIEEQE